MLVNSLQVLLCSLRIMHYCCDNTFRKLLKNRLILQTILFATSSASLLFVYC